MERYVRRFRRPGRINRYGLGLDELPDYGPMRAIEQQKWLHDLTGDRAFSEAHDAFATDMPWR